MQGSPELFHGQAIAVSLTSALLHHRTATVARGSAERRRAADRLRHVEAPDSIRELTWSEPDRWVADQRDGTRAREVSVTPTLALMSGS